MAFDTTTTDPQFPGFQMPLPVKRTKKAARKPPNYAGRNRPKTERLHRVIAQLLQQSDGMTLSELAAAVGMSRQLARYHVLKMVAHKRVVVILEPCEGNGGVQYRVWEKATHAQAAVRWLHEQRGVAA